MPYVIEKKKCLIPICFLYPLKRKNTILSVFAHTYIHKHTHTYTHTNKHTHAHTHINTHTHTHTHTVDVP